MLHQIHVIDSHTAGEPTRVLIDGGPPLGDGPLADRVERFRADHDAYRTAILNEPRGNDVLVGALLCQPHDSTCDVAVIFFNNVGYIGMCGHGMIGVMETLRHLGRVDPGEYRVETPVGVVSTRLDQQGGVSIENVESYRAAKDVTVDVPELGRVTGDVAWGGNWFFMTHDQTLPIVFSNVAELQRIATLIRRAVNAQGFAEVDHVELFDNASDTQAHSRNFVLCPGFEYDRSPCGTGTSAKLACLAADGELQPGESWVQQGILGTTFHGHYQWSDQSRGKIVPTIGGRAFITADAKLLLDQRDPFCWGIMPDRLATAKES